MPLNLHGDKVYICVRPHGMKIPWSGKFHVFSPRNFIGYKTGIAITLSEISVRLRIDSNCKSGN